MLTCRLLRLKYEKRLEKMMWKQMRHPEKRLFIRTDLLFTNNRCQNPRSDPWTHLLSQGEIQLHPFLWLGLGAGIWLVGLSTSEALSDHVLSQDCTHSMGYLWFKPRPFWLVRIRKLPAQHLQGLKSPILSVVSLTLPQCAWLATVWRTHIMLMYHQAWPRGHSPTGEALCYLEWEGQQGQKQGWIKGQQL